MNGGKFFGLVYEAPSEAPFFKNVFQSGCLCKQRLVVSVSREQADKNNKEYCGGEGGGCKRLPCVSNDVAQRSPKLSSCYIY